MSSIRSRHFMLVLALVAAMLLAFACGDDDDADPTAGVETATATATEDEGETPTQPAAETPTQPATEAPQLGDVDVMGVWGDEEIANFEAMVQPWEDLTGGNMLFTGTRGLTEQVTVRVEGGNPPDVIVAPEVGLLQQLVDEGEIVPLSQCTGLEADVRDHYGDAFIDLGSVDGELYGLIMKVDSKGTIFYNPNVFAENGWTPLDDSSTWDDLIALAEDIQADGVTPFSVGIESAEATGWVVTDWIAQILLGETDLATYYGVVDGSVPFDDAAVKDAWEKFGDIVHTDGFVAQSVPDGVVATGFVESTYLPFEDPPEAAMVYLGSFAAGFIHDQFPDLVGGEDYDFMPFPSGAITGGFNVAYATNADETTCSFLAHIASADAQQIWVDAGGFNSANTDIDLSAYTDEVGRKAAEQLLGASAFAGDLDDLVGGEFQSAFFAAAVDYLGDPGSLDSLLTAVEEAR